MAPRTAIRTAPRIDVGCLCHGTGPMHAACAAPLLPMGTAFLILSADPSAPNSVTPLASRHKSVAAPYSFSLSSTVATAQWPPLAVLSDARCGRQAPVPRLFCPRRSINEGRPVCVQKPVAISCERLLRLLLCSWHSKARHTLSFARGTQAPPYCHTEVYHHRASRTGALLGRHTPLRTAARTYPYRRWSVTRSGSTPVCCSRRCQG